MSLFCLPLSTILGYRSRGQRLVKDLFGAPLPSLRRCLEQFAFSVETEMDIELWPTESAPSAPELELKPKS